MKRIFAKKDNKGGFIKNNFFAVALLLILTIYLTNISFFPVYDLDEAFYIDPSCTLSEKGYLGTTVVGNFIGLDKYTYWQPPSYMAIQAFFISLFGCSFIVTRIFSVLAGLGAIAFAYLLAKKIFGKAQAEWAAAFIAISPIFFVVSRQSRMDIYISFFMVSSLYYYVLGREKHDSRIYALSGFLAGLGATSHLNGLFIPAIYFVVFALERKACKMKNATAFFVSMAIPFALWAAYALQDPDTFFLQITFQKGIGFTAYSLGEIVSREMALWSALKYDALFSAFLLLCFAYMFREKGALPIKVALLGWIVYFHIVKPTYWYVAYILPLMAIYGGAAIEKAKSKRIINFSEKQRRLAILLFLALFYAGSLVYASAHHSECDYEAHKMALYSVIPPSTDAAVIGNLQNWILFQNSSYTSPNYVLYNGSQVLESSDEIYARVKEIRPDYLIFHTEDMTTEDQKKVFSSMQKRDEIEIVLLKKFECDSCYNKGFTAYRVFWK